MMQEQMFTQRVKNRHCLSVASLTVFQLNLLVISEWSVWVVLWNFLHKKFPPSAQDKKTILPPQAVPLPLQGRLNVSLTGQHPPNLPHKGGRKRRHKQIARLRNKCAMTCIGDMKQNSFTDMVYSPFTIHLFIPIRTFHVSLLTFH